MIQKMKKLTFLLTKGEYDGFIDSIRELGVIHVEQLQQGATSDALQESLSLAQRYKSVLTALDCANGFYTTKNVYKPIEGDAATGYVKMLEVEQLQEKEVALKHELDSVESAISKLSVWGEIDWSAINRLAGAGMNMYFFSVPSKMYKAEWSDLYFATPISEEKKKIYFVAFAAETPDISAEMLVLPKDSLRDLESKAHDLENQISDIHEELLAINGQYRESLQLAQLETENDIHLLLSARFPPYNRPHHFGL
jgi:V/A-type H+-transporting ATPase subunit I